MMTESAQVLDAETLKQLTGYNRASDVERCLRSQGVRYFRGRNGPWTTLDLLNAAGGLLQYRPAESVDIL